MTTKHERTVFITNIGASTIEIPVTSLIPGGQIGAGSTTLNPQENLGVCFSMPVSSYDSRLALEKWAADNGAELALVWDGCSCAVDVPPVVYPEPQSLPSSSLPPGMTNGSPLVPIAEAEKAP